MTTADSRLKVGLIMPALQVVTEPLYYEIARNECDFFTTRLYLGGTEVRDYMTMEQSLPRAVQELASAKVDVMAYCCTASGAILGYQEEQKNCRQFAQETNIPMTTTMISVVDALRMLQAKRLVLVSPYTEAVNQVEIDFFAKNGFEVLRDAGQAICDGFAISRVTPEEIADFAVKHWDDQADALFMSCMNWQAMRSVAAVEARINKPVITSHSTTLWKVVTMLGRRLHLPQYGKWLFS